MFAIILSYSYYHFFAILKVIQSLYINSTQYFIALIFKVILEIKQEYFKKKFNCRRISQCDQFLNQIYFPFRVSIGIFVCLGSQRANNDSIYCCIILSVWYQNCSFILFEKNVKIVHFETIPMKKCLIDFYYVRERLATEQFVLNFRGLGSSIKKQLILIQSSNGYDQV